MNLTTDSTDSTDNSHAAYSASIYPVPSVIKRPPLFKHMPQLTSKQNPKRIYESLSKSIIGAAMAVHNGLKSGLDEKLYENALVIELRSLGHQVEQQKTFKVDYKDQHIGNLIPDLIIDRKVILDTKVVSDFNDTHLAQMSGYLAITNLRLALLINFKHARLQWKRVIK